MSRIGIRISMQHSVLAYAPASTLASAKLRTRAKDWALLQEGASSLVPATRMTRARLSGILFLSVGPISVGNPPCKGGVAPRKSARPTVEKW